MKIYCECNIC